MTLTHALTRLLTLALLTLTPWLNPALAAQPSAGQIVSGQVLETRDAEPYTYLRIKTDQGEQWAVVDKAAVKKGASASVEVVMVVDNFESKALHKTFSSIIFGNLAGAAPGATNPHAGLANIAGMGPLKLAKATGTNAYTVAEIIGRASQLNNQPVRLSGKVVKVNLDIMGKNWLHLQDGSGNAAQATHDLLVTTTALAKLGDVVTAAGTVHTNVDLGMGYNYKVLIDNATLTRP